ncbi:MAG: hypothetical protein QGH39_10700 [Candidatus Thermoplasmatota archaeon]|nr:hypothetical protein [Candidatus Thermoplasmatota archaeon]MDP7266013.1 hypothetical protein [Candidatus Thermoplasmatota archaeon]
MYKILITCLGNICRSPAAEHLILHRLHGHPLEKRVRISSAGLINPGNRAAEAVRNIVGREMGIASIREHRSRVATPGMMKENDLILPMGIYEMNGILSIHRHGNTKTYLDWIYGTSGKEVEDPYGMGHRHYKKMVELLEGTVDDFLVKMEKILNNVE